MTQNHNEEALQHSKSPMIPFKKAMCHIKMISNHSEVAFIQSKMVLQQMK